jgi:hypothetical protein
MLGITMHEDREVDAHHALFYEYLVGASCPHLRATLHVAS